MSETDTPNETQPVSLTAYRAKRSREATPLRERIEAEIERLIAVLDSMDGDPDLEDACEDEGAQSVLKLRASTASGICLTLLQIATGRRVRMAPRYTYPARIMVMPEMVVGCMTGDPTCATSPLILTVPRGVNVPVLVKPAAEPHTPPETGTWPPPPP